MLVLTRQRGQTIIIGDVQITVRGFGGGGVRLRITAPRHIPIHRKEKYKAASGGDQQTAAEQVPDEAGSPMDYREDDGPGGPESRASHLSLSRRCDETIMIGQDITVTVVGIRRDIRGNKVRLGITAPRHVQVHRQEVFEAIMRGEPRITPCAGPFGSNDLGVVQPDA